ncbi:MAG TPA: glycosyltransferase family 2 protein [Candidatus Nanoarchaeia archaeon]|nr:glycosyltransferase family 2 protein [Candidatus Nanoarchaeia archaeon]
MSAKLSIIVLNWNGKQFLKDCFTSIGKQTSRRNFETLFVDNGSNDGSVEYVRKYFPWVKVHALPKNVGFAKGNNYGIAQAKGEWIFTLNNDTKLDPSCIAHLLAAIRKNEKSPEKIGMYSIKMRFFYELDELNSTGTLIYRDGAAMNRGMREKDHGQYDDVSHRDIFGPCAGAGIYRKDMLTEIAHAPSSRSEEEFMRPIPEYFDADFFIYLEDVDLIWRAQLAGWKARYVPKSLLYHIHSATMEAKSPKKLYLAERNRIWYTFKIFPLPLLLISPFFTLRRYLAMRSTSGSPAAGKASLALALLRAWIHGVFGLPKFFTKRRQIQKSHLLGSAEVRRLFNRYGASLDQLVQS